MQIKRKRRTLNSTELNLSSITFWQHSFHKQTYKKKKTDKIKHLQIQSNLNNKILKIENRDEKAKLREAVIANVRQQVANIKKEPAIQRAMASNKIAVVGAFYEITSGAVDFFETDEELRVAQNAYDSCNWREHLA